MKKVLIRLTMVAALFAVFVLCGSAQLPRPEQKPPATPPPQNEQPPSPCPAIDIRGPQKPIRDGEQVGFTVTLSGGDPKVAPMYNWSISAGTMVSGQGTRNIGVDSTGASVDKAITANVQIGGFPPECTADATTTLYIAGTAKKFDEYGSLTETDENARLDAFISNVTDKEQAYIFAYAGRTSARGQAAADLKRIRAYLLKAGTPKERVVTIDGGYREELSHELWLVPLGADAPRSTPTLKAKDIVFPKTTPPASKP